MTGRKADTMKAFASASYDSTRQLNPECDSWKDTIWGDYVPTLSFHDIDSEMRELIVNAVRAAARKEPDDERASEMLHFCADVNRAWTEAVQKAAEKDAEARNKYAHWLEAQKATERAETPTEGAQEV